MDQEWIVVRGAREHNLKNIDVRFPRNALVVVTGLSGSGKSTLAFDTLYAEGQRRYVESLSAYARQFLEQLEKPDVESIEGLSPAISIEQRTAGSNPRSTIATTTEIYDYLRLLFARVGTPHCYRCGRPIHRQSAEEIVRQILTGPSGSRVQILAPLVRGRKGEYRQLLLDMRREGFVRVRVNGQVHDLGESIALDKQKKHSIEVVVDRLVLGDGIKQRLTDSVETALKTGKGTMLVVADAASSRSAGASAGAKSGASTEQLYSEQYACVRCGISMEELQPRNFSFNSPYGACELCHGLGTQMTVDPERVVPDKSRSIREGAIEPWRRGGMRIILYYRWLLRQLARDVGFSLDVPFESLDQRIQELIVHGRQGREDGHEFEGVIPNLQRRFRETESEFVKEEIGKYLSAQSCSKCRGSRLRPESLAVKVVDQSIIGVTTMTVDRAVTWFVGLSLTEQQQSVARQVLKEIVRRLEFLRNVGLGYLTLDRMSSTLSGGEAQRIRLATQIGAGLVGVLYILDEPSIGLHQRDNQRLLDTLKTLRDVGNTLVVVEHDEATIRAADYVIDLGPGAGKHGGEVVAAGSLDAILQSRASLTGGYLRGELMIPVPAQRRSAGGRQALVVKRVAEHNLKSIDVKIPLGLFVCVTGVSGSGKSTLVDDVLYRALSQHFYGARERPGRHGGIVGLKYLDKVIVVDQSPIGRTPRSNPATYTDVFTDIRTLFSRLPDAKVRGYKPGRFSFNVKGGRCEACSGDGIKRIEMHFLPDVYVHCEVCKGRRFNEQTLEVKFKGASIADVLAMTVEESCVLFDSIPSIARVLRTLIDVGLGYIELGQPATTLSGGEAQRVKLSTELSRRATGRTLYILDEPTSGLHFADIDKLLKVLHALVDAGNTVLVIEHNLDVIKTADYIIDLGPEGGEAGGELVAVGTPEEVSRVERSHTGCFLRPLLHREVAHVAS